MRYNGFGGEGRKTDVQFKVSYKIPERTLSALEVCNTGMQRCEGGYSWGPGVRDHYLAHYVASGRGVYQTGGRLYALSAGDVFLARPDENIFYQADAQEPWVYYWVGFHGSDARLLLDQTDLRRQPVLRGAGDETAERMRRIYEARGGLPWQTAEMAGLLYQLLAAWMRASQTAAPRRESDAVSRACAFISNNFAMPIGVADIAAHVGLSRSRLYRRFMDELEQSPLRVLTGVRIHQACALLRRGGLSVREVAASVGYEDPLYFSRRFRELMGASPTDYAAAKRDI